MSLLTAYNLAKSFGPEDIFEGISVEIPHGARIALVGPNGAGKTTLLNIMIGADTPTEGSISVAKNTRIGFLPQRPELLGSHTLWEEQLSAFGEVRHMEAQLAQLEHAMADPKRHDEALAKYGPLQERFELADGYLYEHRIRTVLQGLGFTTEEYQKPLSMLSGGQKTRALLARLLLDSPDLLVLDEPTNHLDIQAVEWLEGFLKSFSGAVLAVSHDRYFMDAFAMGVWELDFGTIETYRGNYSHYVRQREERYERRLKEYEAQQEFLAKEEEYIRRNIAGQNTRQAKGKLKRLETMKKRGKFLNRPKQRKTMFLRMGRTVRSGDKVLMTQNLVVGYPDADEPLFQSPDITLYRGETAALIGPNGVGKSTFLKTIIGQLQPLAGETRIGAAVKIGYFAQAHELLDPKKAIIDEVQTVKAMPIGEARNYLAQFLFTGDDVFRPVETLSGGERGRVALAKLALSGSNLLLLDEPTNHLDIDSQEILQAVLDSFDGTILLVSHDRYLIDALATQIWAANLGELKVFEGTYSEYVAERDKQAAANAAVQMNGRAQNGDKKQAGVKSVSQKKHGLNSRQVEKRIAEVEAQIEALETKIESLHDAINDASSKGNAARVRELGEQYTQAEADLHETMTAWEALVD
jgi:ATP-binding cassette, subfamily F, member 3